MEVLKIGADWCSGCLIMRPRWKEIEQENPWLKTRYLDYDADHDEVSKFTIDKERLPIFIFFGRNGNELLRLNGEISKNELFQVISQYREQ